MLDEGVVTGLGGRVCIMIGFGGREGWASRLDEDDESVVASQLVREVAPLTTRRLRVMLGCVHDSAEVRAPRLQV